MEYLRISFVVPRTSFERECWIVWQPHAWSLWFMLCLLHMNGKSVIFVSMVTCDMGKVFSMKTAQNSQVMVLHLGSHLTVFVTNQC